MRYINEHQEENKAWCKVCENYFDDIIDLEIHERIYHDTSFLQIKM